MAIPFTQIPNTLLVPGQYQEIDNSFAGETEEVKKALIIATMASTGTATVGKAIQIRSRSKAKVLFGNGSPAAIMAESFLNGNKIEQLWVLPIAEPTAGAKWKQTFTPTIGSGSSSGSVTVNVNGRKVSAEVTAGDTKAKITAAIVAAINGMDNCPVDATVNADSNITVTSIIKGTTANALKVEMISNVTGITITVAAATLATGTATIKTALQELGSVRYNYMASEFNDSENITALSAELESRYIALRQIGGRCFIPLSGDIGDNSTEGTMLAAAKTINSPHIILVPHGTSIELPCVWAATWCASLCRVLADDPSANTTDTKIPDVIGQEYAFDDRQALLEAGICTYRLDSTGNVLIERAVTSYTENSDKDRDTSYLDMQVVETIDAIRTYINLQARKRFKTWKLARTEENFGAGAKVMTPGVWKSFLTELYQSVFIGEKAWCQDLKSYIESIIVEIKSESKTWLEYQHCPELIGQFYIGTGLNQFK